MNAKAATGVQVKGLSKKYGKREIFDKFSIEFPQKQVSMIIGKNGAGKSTLLRILSGSEAFNKGKIIINGENLIENRVSVMDSIFFVSEEFNFTLPYKIGGIQNFFKDHYSRWNSDDYLKWIEEFKINSDGHFAQLSRGQKMQVACSIALATNPQVLMLDEMTSVLDAHARHLLLAEIELRSRKGMMTLLATNMVSEARELNDAQVFILRDQDVTQLTTQDLQHFVKIMVDENFILPANFWRIPSQKNSNGTITYITADEELGKIPKKHYVVDRRGNSVEEFFIYHSAREAQKHDKAA